MNGLRAVVFVVIAGLAMFGAWYLLAPKPAPPRSQPPPELFDATRPLGVAVSADADTSGQRADVEWLAHELRYLLARNGMHVEPVTAASNPKFELTVAISADGTEAHLVRPRAPDNPLVIDKVVTLPANERLAALRAIVAELPGLLDSTRRRDEWLASIGTDDAGTYDTYRGAASTLLGPEGRGFTRTLAPERASPLLESLETMTRRKPEFARAWALLALVYLGQGGKDETSLGRLARTSADRALALDAGLADAHAALGLLALRDNDWTSAHEQLHRAIELDANSLAALEGAACLAADMGQSQAALAFAQRAAALQPDNVGTRECASFASGVIDAAAPAHGMTFAPMVSLLANDVDTARTLLPRTAWADAVLKAAQNPGEMRHALQALTREANEKHLDALSEILSGTALKQPDFVFNRLLRLKRQHQPAPLRVLWLPQTGFLRQQARFDEIVAAFGLPAYWQAHGAADLCAKETLHGCPGPKP